MNYVTEPQGAYVTYQGPEQSSVGLAPARRAYGNDPAYLDNGCYRVRGVTATWASGAQRSSDPVLRLCNGPGSYTLTLTRPADAPGLDQDIQFALQLEQAEAAQRQQEQAALLNSLLIWQAVQPRPSYPSPARTYDIPEPTVHHKTTSGTIYVPGAGPIRYRETTR